MTGPPLYRSAGDYARPPAEPDRRTLFRRLRDEWVRGADGRTQAGLAAALDAVAGAGQAVTPQRIRDWAADGSDRAPPWWVVLWLCREVGAVVRLAPDLVTVEVAGPPGAP